MTNNMNKMLFTHHPFHLVSISPWPLMISLSIFNNLISVVCWFNKINTSTLSIPCTILCMILWWRDVIREATFTGSHTKMVYSGMRMGMILFIISEILFFISFFWAYFHSSLAPSIDIGQLWPPSGITPFNPFNIPLLNTIILISSGLTITWSHHSLLTNLPLQSEQSLILTILLGLYFTMIQLMEYQSASFTISDSIYGSTFFMATGFHGLHVMIGTTFLIVCYNRMSYHHFSKYHHFGFEAGVWYWHFVDIVWLFLYLSIYWWGY